MRSTVLSRLGLLACSMLLSACISDTPVSPDPSNTQSTSFAISDGAHSGNPHFYFLPPMVPAPTSTGTFDGTKQPIAQITEDGQHLVDLPAAVPQGSEQYLAVWHTNDFALDPFKSYRITILVAGVALGYADVDVVSSGNQLKNVNTGEYIPLLDGKTLPIKFRIEAGAMPVGWRLIAAKGTGPADINASTLVAPLKAVFAARMWDYSAGTLWRFDLTTDTWKQLPADNWPIGKYRNLIYDAPNHRLMTYWDGLGQVYTIPETGGSWTALGSAGNSEEYYEGYGFFNPVTNRIAVFAGYGFGTWKNLLWEWDAGTNQWLNLPQSTVRPEPRFGHGPSTTAIDEKNHRAFLGQRSLGAAPGNYDDLWALDLTSNSWTNLIPPSTGDDGRLGSALAFAAPTATLYRFGGCGLLVTSWCTSLHNELLSATPDIAPVAWVTMPATGPTPAPRVGSGLFFDSDHNRLVLVSGLDGVAWLDDVWAYYLP